MADPDIIMRIHGKGYPVISSSIINELKALSGHGASQATLDNVDKMDRLLARESPNLVNALPDGQKPRRGDKFLRFDLGWVELYQIHRSRRHPGSSYSARNLGIARDYGLRLLTRTRQNHEDAKKAGVKSTVWKGRQSSQRSSARTSAASGPRPFAVATSVSGVKDHQIAVSSIPDSGDIVTLSGTTRQFRLRQSIGTGGEGTVYHTPNANMVAKIYRKEKITGQRFAKLKLMVSRDVSYPGICWPKSLLANQSGEFVGYLMPKAEGHTLQKSVFVKKLLLAKFPGWTRKNLVNVCIGFLERVEYLHNLNVVVGDINPLNTLVHGDGRTSHFVDVDSYQVEGFACPVGTVNFSAPEVLNWQSYSSKLRTKEHELFAVATMLFMILLPGKPPYSQQGGDSQKQNILKGRFPYPYGTTLDASRLPAGSWRYIWTHLPDPVQEAFHQAFRQGIRHPVSHWLELMEEYHWLLDRGYVTEELFPRGFDLRKGEQKQIHCSICRQQFPVHSTHYEFLKLEGRQPKCTQCLEKERLKNRHFSAASPSPGSSHSPSTRSASVGSAASTQTKKPKKNLFSFLKSKAPSSAASPSASSSRPASAQSKKPKKNLFRFLKSKAPSSTAATSASSSSAASPSASSSRPASAQANQKKVRRFRISWFILMVYGSFVALLATLYLVSVAPALQVPLAGACIVGVCVGIFKFPRYILSLLALYAFAAGWVFLFATNFDDLVPGPLLAGTGSAFVVSDKGHLLTNAHVVEGCDSIAVNGLRANVLKASGQIDLALIQARHLSGNQAAVFAQQPASLNLDIAVVGFPLGGILGGLNITRGTVSATKGLKGSESTMQISAPVQPGNSGGPVLDASGSVVGVVVAKLNAVKFAEETGDIPQNVNFAIRGRVAKQFLSQNGVKPLMARRASALDPIELGKRAQSITYLVECLH
ncbi:MAG: trypsin-like peptidase domain-containing protein [Rhodobacteraceae bacterium]|nr:trypsin-like peptidase domain-containing protein [Paracoccaceae bacterium]